MDLFGDTLKKGAGGGGDGVAEGGFVRVAIERGLERIDGEEGLTYRLDEPALVGQRVEVPLGRKDRSTLGVIIKVGGGELAGGVDPGVIKPVQRLVGSPLPGVLVSLAEWMSVYYVCPLGMVFGTMVPAAVKRRVGSRKEILVELGDVTGDEDGAPKLTPTMRKAWEGIRSIDAGSFPMSFDRLVGESGASNRGPINRLVEFGMLRQIERSRIKAPPLPWDPADGDALAVPDTVPELTDAQRAIVDGIGASIESFGAHLIRGVTGSGKTEIYLRLIEGVLGRGEGAIVLVPEIALTPQTAGRFIARFAKQGVAVLHSGLTASQRHAQWESVARGESRVVVGARSALFCPMPDVGIIVVDEEHDDSGYKQDQLPRYHARDVAVMRAHFEGCPVVLGSATPSLESWANTKGAHAKYRLWELTERVAGGSLPKVRIVDLRDERRERTLEDPGSAKMFHLLGPTLEEEVGSTLDDGGQVLLFLNRRGFASYVACPDGRCGWVASCERCDAAMVQHRTSGGRALRFVRCHHCLDEAKLPEICPLCDRKLILMGGGTQRLEDELIRKFGASHQLVDGDTLMRVDGDTMRSARDYFTTLRRFALGEIRVLLGTQMIAKGLDVPNVRLVGVVNADTALSMPDFRASERTFQLVSQVAGRAGRRDVEGRVIVQSMVPKAPPIQLAAAHDYVRFADTELGIRQQSGLPPVTRLARIVCRDPDWEKAQASASALAGRLREQASEMGGAGVVRVVGPMACPIARIANQFRFAVEVSAPDRRSIQKALGALRGRGLLKSDAHTAVDVDPIALM